MNNSEFRKKIMPEVAVIFNGVHFGQAVADKALAYAKQSSENVIALFLKAAHEKPENYGFANDLGETGTFATDKDVESDDMNIIESNMRLLEHEATIQKIMIQPRLLENPKEEQLQALVQDCAIIFIQNHDEHGDETPGRG